jgi:hypothetical protein
MFKKKQEGPAAGTQFAENVRQIREIIGQEALAVEFRDVVRMGRKMALPVFITVQVNGVSSSVMVSGEADPLLLFLDTYGEQEVRKIGRIMQAMANEAGEAIGWCDPRTGREGAENG